jgi:type II secretory pathway component GspD/PulD (secretin)
MIRLQRSRSRQPFRSRTKREDSDELMIFITPRIIRCRGGGMKKLLRPSRSTPPPRARGGRLLDEHAGDDPSPV